MDCDGNSGKQSDDVLDAPFSSKASTTVLRSTSCSSPWHRGLPLFSFCIQRELVKIAVNGKRPFTHEALLDVSVRARFASRTSFENVEDKWKHEIGDAPILLVGTKLDLCAEMPPSACVSYQEGQADLQSLVK